MEFNKQPGDESYDEDKTAEYVVRQPEFRDGIMSMYKQVVNEALAEKRWFSKLDALEAFTDFWGTHPKHMMASYPMENSYVPAIGIVPIPMFRNYDKEDPEGREMSYRQDGIYNHGPLTQPSTLKQHQLSPRNESYQTGQAMRNHGNLKITDKRPWGLF